MTLKFCAICWNKFDTNHGNKKTCSPECSRKLRLEREHRRGARRRLNPEYQETQKKRIANWFSDPINKKRNQEKYREWAIKNKKRRDEYVGEWRSRPENKAKRKINNANYAARKRELPSNFTDDQWGYALLYFNGCCAVCERPLKDLFNEHTAAMDHWIPLDYIGDNNPGTVATNIVPLCHGSNGCNNSKHDTSPEVWLERKFGKRKSKQIIERVEMYFEHVRGLAT